MAKLEKISKKKSVSRYKTITKSKKQYQYTKKHNSSINKQKTLRSIFVYSQSLKNDAEIYKNEFIKQGYKVDLKLIESILYNSTKNKEKYYDVNLFLETLPFKCKLVMLFELPLFSFDIII